jgi:tetratricopeptide (TPR) repeat protein
MRGLKVFISGAALCLFSSIPLRAFQTDRIDALSNSNFSIAGTVYYGDTGKSAEHVTVELHSGEGGIIAPQATNEMGRFEFRSLIRGSYMLEIDVQNYERVSMPVDLTFNSYKGLTINLKPSSHRQPAQPGPPISQHELSMPKKARAAMTSGKKKLYEGKNAQGALADFEQAIAIAPGYYEAYYEIAMADLTLGKQWDAEANLRKSIQVSADKYGSAVIGLGTVLLDRGDLAEGEKTIRHGLELDPNSWLGYYELGQVLFKKNDFGEAEKAAAQARTHAPNMPSVYRLLANIHLAQKNYAAVVQDLDAYIKLDPGSTAGLRAKELRTQVASKAEGKGDTAMPEPEPGTPLGPGGPVIEAKGTTKERSASVAVLHWTPPDTSAPLFTISSHPGCSLEDVLKRAGERAIELVANLQTYTAREKIEYQKLDSSGEPEESRSSSFKYSVKIEEGHVGLSVREIRTPASGDVAVPEDTQDQGLPEIALIFYPDYQRDYEMGCEGVDQWNGQAAWVIRFQQREHKRSRTRSYRKSDEAYPAKLKGRAWISVEGDQLLHIDTNLIETIPSISLISDAVSLDYGPVEFPSRNMKLWMPKTAEVFTDFGYSRYIVRHTFSNFLPSSDQAEDAMEKPNQP